MAIIPKVIIQEPIEQVPPEVSVMNANADDTPSQPEVIGLFLPNLSIY